MRLIASLWICVLSATPCAATTVIALRNDEAFVVAADSKMINSNGIPGREIPSRVCKIIVIPNKIIASAGFFGHDTFSVLETARRTLGAEGNSSSLLVSFEAEMKRALPTILTEMYMQRQQEYETLVRHQRFIQMVFGLVEDGIVKAFHIEFVANNPDDISMTINACPGDCPPGIVAVSVLGERKAIDGELARDREIFNRLGTAGALNRLMELQAQATPDYVGMPVSIARLKRDGHVQWDQAGYCEQ